MVRFSPNIVMELIVGVRVAGAQVELRVTSRIVRRSQPGLAPDCGFDRDNCHRSRGLGTTASGDSKVLTPAEVWNYTERRLPRTS